MNAPLTKPRPSRETLGERMLRHGHTAGRASGRNPSPTYQSWCAMITRCTNPNQAAYKRYGAAGVTICERWRQSFDNFLADMGERPPGRTLDRYPDKNGNYEPGNCRWATWPEQRRNQARNRAVERDDGLRFPTIIDAAEQTGANRRCIRDCCIGRQKTHRGHAWRFVA